MADDVTPLGPLADGTTPNYGWTLPTVMADFNTWGGLLNANLSAQDSQVFAISNVANGAMPKTGGNFTGSVTVTNNTSNNSFLYLDGPTAIAKVQYFTTGGVNRWAVFASGEAETGANAGTNFRINAYSDAGVAIAGEGPVFQIIRATGLATFSQGLTVQGPLTGAAATFSGLTTVSGSPLLITGAPATNRVLQYQTNGVNRWFVFVDSSAENPPNNVGSNFYIQSINDSGAPLSNCLAIARNSGAVTMPNSVYTGPLFVTGAITGSAGVTVSGGVTANGGQIQVSSGGSSLQFQLYSSAAGVDNKYWRLFMDTSGTLSIQTVNDAYNAAASALQITRSGLTVTGIALDAPVTVNNILQCATAAQPITHNAAAGTNRGLAIYTSGVSRWQVLGDSTAEGPVNSNNGTNFVIARYNDAGAYVDEPFSIQRNTGQVTINGPTVFGNTVAHNTTTTAPTPAKSNNSTNVATTAFAANQGMELWSYVVVPAGAHFYPSATHSGHTLLLQNNGYTVYMPGGAASFGTWILSNIVGADVGLSLPGGTDFRASGLLHAGEKVILQGDGTNGYYRCIQYSPPIPA
jgi:hypothetical protein